MRWEETANPPTGLPGRGSGVACDALTGSGAGRRPGAGDPSSTMPKARRDVVLTAVDGGEQRKRPEEGAGNAAPSLRQMMCSAWSVPAPAEIKPAIVRMVPTTQRVR